MKSFYEAYNWLERHPVFFTPKPMTDDGDNYSLEGFCKSLEMAVVLVDPATKQLSKDPSKNTQVQVFLEVGLWTSLEGAKDLRLHRIYTDWTPRPPRDEDLSSQGDTYEAAIIQLANKVLDKYGEYRFESEALCPEVSPTKKCV